MMQQAKVSALFQPNQQLENSVREYGAIANRLFDEAKKPGFTDANWAALAALVDVNEFTWISPGYEQLNWHDYINYLNQWARVASWDSTFKRIHQWQDSVFLEQEERCTVGDTVDIVGMIAVFDFNAAGKIRRLAIYMQHQPSLGL